MIPLDISQVISKSQELPGWCPVDKSEMLVALILSMKPQIVVETGIFGGRSLIPMAATCKYLNTGIVWGIDPWDVEASLEGEHKPEDFAWWGKLNHEGIYDEFVLGTLKFKLGKYCRWLRMKSEQAARLFDDRTVDIFHCDGNHSELASCKDVEMWLPKMKPGGYWCHDDLDWATNERAWRLISKDREIIFDNGKWGIVQI